MKPRLTSYLIAALLLLSRVQSISLAQDKTATPSLDASGGIYLFDYQPLIKGLKNNFEIYAFVLRLDASTADKAYGLHVESRIRDSRLRAFYTSNIWFQEAYAFAKLSFGAVHIGEFYRRVGIFWDDTFFGNVQYFNGLKLNPDFGAELLGTFGLQGTSGVNYSLQYIANNDHVDGAIPGRDVESDANARLTNTVTGRLEPVFKLSDDVSLSVGVSGLAGTIERTIGDNFRLNQLAADASLIAGTISFYGEVLRQTGERNDASHPLSRPGYDDATYVLAGAKWKVLPDLTARFGYSSATYDGADAVETELLPGLVFSAASNINLIGEFDYWELKPTVGKLTVLDRSVNIVINYNF